MREAENTMARRASRRVSCQRRRQVLKRDDVRRDAFAHTTKVSASQRPGTFWEKLIKIEN